ncbi:MAG TPA: DUF4149 domain-containing protein [Gemmatimonadaceae bacterium]|jgi:hypothetical protein|nr:DUF4149 domain-containing protein [Gemmatimonadaceae bacterium]
MRGAPAVAVVSAWLGASALFAAVVAPAAFEVLPSRALAGAVVGRVLPVIFVAGIVAALLGIWLDRAAVGRVYRVRRAAFAVMALACAAAQFGVAPRIERVRAEIGGALDALPPGDARRIVFGRLHAISVGWLGLAMVAAGATIVLALLPAATGRAGDHAVAPTARPMEAGRTSR